MLVILRASVIAGRMNTFIHFVFVTAPTLTSCEPRLERFPSTRSRPLSRSSTAICSTPNSVSTKVHSLQAHMHVHSSHHARMREKRRSSLENCPRSRASSHRQPQPRGWTRLWAELRFEVSTREVETTNNFGASPSPPLQGHEWRTSTRVLRTDSNHARITHSPHTTRTKS